ncbi:uncharacterized protein [Hetaerina americana]|uniref:uncharacterized protein n=1 Tax=Hetaerina americana TaxID=62018 RepID=UPI003A7F1175
MNRSIFSKSCIVDDGVDEALNENFLSTYLNIMTDKHCKSMSSAINVDMEKKYMEEMIQCKKFMCALKREDLASGILGGLKYLEEEHNSHSSLSDASIDVMDIMNPLKNEFERSLHQLPSKGFQILSSSQQLAMIEKLKRCDELLEKCYEHYSEDLTEKSVLVQNLQTILLPDTQLRKEKCDSLMEAINDTAIKESADISAKTAVMLLDKKSKVESNNL